MLSSRRSRMARRVLARDSLPSDEVVLPRQSKRTAPQPPKGPCVDLLHPEPRMTIDDDLLVPQLGFAFAGGDAADTIKHYLSEVCLERSDWESASFAKHLYVDHLIQVVCIPEIDGKPRSIDQKTLLALLTNPPADPAILDHRRAILARLAEDEGLRTELVELYRRLEKLRKLFLVTQQEGRDELFHRRLETLAAIRAIVEHMASGFDDPDSPLKTVRETGAQIAASEGFGKLCDLLDHERNLATVDLSLQLGADGRVRKFGVGRIAENSDNRFYESPTQRLWSRILLWLRGYRFNENELVNRWIDAVYVEVEPLLPGLLQLVGQVEFYLAALAFRDRCAKAGLEVSMPDLSSDGPRRIEGLFNPLLFAQNVTPVPCDLDTRGPGAITLVTGPNSGGKTRLLQALGLTQLLAQVGFFVPARQATLRRVPGIFCSLVQEEAFDQAEGRLGTELLRIRRLFERARPGALVILDELCSGTNPSEGEEIFMLVISLLNELEPETFVTTHFLGFAHRLQERADELGLSFLQVELDEHEHPTFGFVEGVASTSLAAQAAARLGVTREELLTLVKRKTS
ncbi:MAG: DNA mismatch repair protein [Deltaproteobacteria bacterium]